MALSASHFATKKLLITDVKPKSDPDPASSSSTTSAPPPPEKRTRDQPNLSDCHGCGCRINYTNPKDRLQPLDSVWRIVLLCRRCRESLHSGKNCPYCFQETGNSVDLRTCRVCRRKIHSDCVRDYGNWTPWCYVGVGLEGFKVCVDCWVPESLKKSIRVSGRSETKGGLKDKGETVDLLADEAKCGVEKKAKRAVKAKVNVLRKANGNSNCSDAVDVGDDRHTSQRILKGKSVLDSNTGRWKGLSYQRSRFRKVFCDDYKLGTGDDGAENERMNQQPVENDPSIASSGLWTGLVPYKRDRRRKIWLLNNENVELENLHSDDPRTSCSTKSGADASADSVCADTDRQNGDRFGPHLVMYRRTRFKKKDCQMSSMLAVSRDSSYCDSHGVAFRSDNSQPDDTNLGTLSPAKSDINVILPSESCDAERDGSQMKYFKRMTGTKPYSYFLHVNTFVCVNQVAAADVSNSGAGCSVDDGQSILQNGTCDQETDRYSLKYAKRVKSSKSGSNFEAELQSDAFLNKIKISAPGLTVNCSAESRTVSGAS